MKSAPAQVASPAPDTAMLDLLRERAGSAGVLNYREFTALALYAPQIGYYTRPGIKRVGRDPRSDFYTASSLQGHVFGRLIKAAAADLLKPESPSAYTLFEIGAEPGHGAFGNVAGQFAAVQSCRLGDPLEPPPRAVIFGNEVLDAQPFHRLMFRDGQWREMGVQVDGEGIGEVELHELSPQIHRLQEDLPPEVSGGYRLDISLDAEVLLRKLIRQPWSGLLLFSDYGYDWMTLAHDRPIGTARAYRAHKVSGDLLNRPGEQDLTCHVCWDRLEHILRSEGVETLKVETQESFFAHHAAAEIENMLKQQDGPFSKDRQTILELTHPTHLGHRFQFLWARRD